MSYINLGNNVLFVGLGFSIGVENISGTPLPAGDRLVKYLYRECDELSDGGNLLDASELYLRYNDSIYLFFEKVKLGASAKRILISGYGIQIGIIKQRLSGADKYFETAYTHAYKKREFETFAIDNHYARYILENELESGTLEIHMETFLQAHFILMDSLYKTKVRFHHYKVVQNLYSFL